MAKVAKELGLLDVFRTLPPIKDFDPEVSGFEVEIEMCRRLVSELLHKQIIKSLFFFFFFLGVKMIIVVTVMSMMLFI